MTTGVFGAYEVYTGMPALSLDLHDRMGLLALNRNLHYVYAWNNRSAKDAMNDIMNSRSIEAAGATQVEEQEEEEGRRIRGRGGEGGG
jgi:hypothetical protein